MIHDLDRLLKLPSAEKLALIDVLWESVYESEPAALLTPAQWQDAQQRLGEMKDHPERSASHQQIKQRLAALRQDLLRGD